MISPFSSSGRARRVVTLIACAALVASACGTDPTTSAADATAPGGLAAPSPDRPTTITLVTHESFALSEEVLAAFTAETGITVEILTSGDAGIALNQSILSAGNPLGDVIFGVDNTFMSRALDADILDGYNSPLLAEIPDEYELDPTNRLLPVDVGDVCLNSDVEYFAQRDLAPPGDLLALTDAAYRDLLVVQNPATSSPGLAFLLASIAEFGTSGDYPWTTFWADLRANGVRVSPGWSEAYYGDFTWAGGGDRPIVVSYASSPPAEVFFADPPLESAPTAVVESTCFRQQEFVGILAGTDEPASARAFVDFLLGVTAQNDIPWNMFVFPVNSNATPPPEFLEHSVIPADPLSVPSTDVEENREAWIEEWTDIVVR